MLEQLKEIVCKANLDLVKHGLVIFTWGNVSAIDREKGLVAIKPSGVSYEKLVPEDIVIVDLYGKVVEGSKRPSSDTLSHLVLYKNFPEIKAVVHTHSPHATIFAQAGKPVPCLGTTHADYFYGAVPVCRSLAHEEIFSNYEENTGKVIVEHFQREKLDPNLMPACLAANHGPFVWGNSVDNAVHNAVVLERVSEMALATLRLANDVKPLSSGLLDKHFLRKHGPGAYYGQKGA